MNKQTIVSNNKLNLLNGQKIITNIKIILYKIIKFIKFDVSNDNIINSNTKIEIKNYLKQFENSYINGYYSYDSDKQEMTLKIGFYSTNVSSITSIPYKTINIINENTIINNLNNSLTYNETINNDIEVLNNLYEILTKTLTSLDNIVGDTHKDNKKSGSLIQLTDVNITTKKNNDVLAYDELNNIWTGLSLNVPYAIIKYNDIMCNDELITPLIKTFVGSSEILLYDTNSIKINCNGTYVIIINMKLSSDDINTGIVIMIDDINISTTGFMTSIGSIDDNKLSGQILDISKTELINIRSGTILKIILSRYTGNGNISVNSIKLSLYKINN